MTHTTTVSNTTTETKAKKKSLRVRLAEKAAIKNREIHERGHFTVKDRVAIEEIVALIWWSRQQ